MTKFATKLYAIKLYAINVRFIHSLSITTSFKMRFSFLSIR